MEAYSSSSSSSSSSKSGYPFQFQSQSLLHSVRKVNAKPWKKPAVAPLPPTPIKVYKVDPMNFRNLVQQLTGAPEFQSHQNAAPSLDVASAALPSNPSRDIINIIASSPPYTRSMSNNNNSWYQDVESDALGMKREESMTPSASLLELNLLSPSSYNWSSFPLMSPGTITGLESGRVL